MLWRYIPILYEYENIYIRLHDFLFHKAIDCTLNKMPFLSFLCPRHPQNSFILLDFFYAQRILQERFEDLSFLKVQKVQTTLFNDISEHEWIKMCPKTLCVMFDISGVQCGGYLHKSIWLVANCKILVS